MGAKEAIRGLLERMPDDCNLVDVIDEIMKLDGPWLDEADLPRLTQTQRDALDESVAHHKQHPERALPWREALRSTGHRE
jgi:hypothetical protein